VRKMKNGRVVMGGRRVWRRMGFTCGEGRGYRKRKDSPSCAFVDPTVLDDDEQLPAKDSMHDVNSPPPCYSRAGRGRCDGVRLLTIDWLRGRTHTPRGHVRSLLNLQGIWSRFMGCRWHEGAIFGWG